MRYVVFGAGAIGATIGARLFESGHDVVLIARGPHLEALRADGLRFGDPERTRVLRIPVAGDPTEVSWEDDDVVVIAVKAQGTEGAAHDLVAVAPPSIAVVCAQNGVENERVVLRYFASVYGMCVMMPATHVVPGAVDADSLPIVGVLDVGRYPDGSDDVARRIAADLSRSGFRSTADPAIMRWKYDKLLVNLATPLRAMCGPESDDDDHASVLRTAIVAAVTTEAHACFERAEITLPTEDERAARWDGAVTPRPIPGRPRVAGSGWQSLARGTGNIESDYLNGEIVLMGRVHGVATPANEAVQRLSNDVARQRLAPGSRTLADVAAAAHIEV